MLKLPLRLRDRYLFMWQSLEILNIFNTLTLKPIFSKSESLPYKSSLSEANVKTNRMERTRWTYDKERSFASTCFSFSKILFHFKNSV